MMRSYLVVVIVFMLCSQIPLSVQAEERLSVIQRLIQHVEQQTVSVNNITLEEIAVITYQVLLDIPFDGVQDSQAELEGIITLKDALIIHSGMLERLLTLRMQEAFDCTLLNEVNRRTMALRKEPMTPAYKEGSLSDELLRALLDRNVIVEAEQIQYVLNLNGTFAKFCRQKNFDVDDILSAKATRAFSAELKKKLMSDIFGEYLYGEKKMDEEMLQDLLFGYTLLLIDQARDVRILCEVFLTDPSFSLSMIDTRKIDKVLALYPRRRQLSTGMKTRGRWVFPVGSYCASPEPYHFPIILTGLFEPYFSDVEAIAAQHEGIFSWYNESGAKNLSEFETGMWLKLKK